MTRLLHLLPRNPQPLFDGLALTLSGLCLLHCLALPLALGAAPALGLLAAEGVHLWMLLSAVPTSLLALGLGCRVHRRLALLGWAITGLMLMGLAVTGGTLGLVSEPAERLLTSSGGLLLAATHIRNHRHCRRPRAKA